MDTFNASVQYDDWKGTAAADDADFKLTLRDYLRAKKLIEDDEHIIATSLWVGENQGGQLGSVLVSVFLYPSNGDFDAVKDELEASAGAVSVRQVDLDLSLEDFVVLFKRLHVWLTRKALNLSGRAYIAT